MKTRRIVLLAILGLPAMACKPKPSKEACRDAVENVRKIADLDTAGLDDPSAQVRSCVANSSRATVKCMRNAKSLADIQSCEGEEGVRFYQEAEEAEQTRLKEADVATPEGSDKNANAPQEAPLDQTANSKEATKAPTTTDKPATATENTKPADENTE